MTETAIYGSTLPNAENYRDKWKAMRLGFRKKCPSCGEGELFTGYVKCVDSCSSCGEEMHHQRADDFPAYLCIFIVGHTLIPLFVALYALTDINMWVQMAFFLPFTVLATLWLLPRVKGAVIALQWALKMHGFGGHGDEEIEI